MKKIIISITILFTTANLYAQNKTLDSLKLQISKEQTDTGRIKLLDHIGYLYGYVEKMNDSSMWYFQKALSLAKGNNLPSMEVMTYGELAYSTVKHNPDRSLHWAHQALYLARKYKLKKEEMRILEYLTNINSPLLEKDSVEKYFNRAMELVKQMHSTKTEFNLLMNYGFFCFARGSYFKALNAELKALNLAKQENNKSEIISAMYMIGKTYGRDQEYRKALSYLLEGTKLSAEIKDSSYLPGILVEIGKDYIKLAQSDSARIYAKKCYEVSNIQFHGHIIGGVLDDLGQVYSALGEDSLAMVYFRQSFQNFVNNGNVKRNICESLLGIAKIYKKAGYRDSAFYYAARAFPIANKNNYLEYVLEASKFLGDYYKNRHSMDSAFKYQAIEFATHDSLFSLEKTREVAEINFTEQLHQQELDQKLQQERARYKNSLRIYILIGCLIVLLLIAGGLFRNNRNRRKANILLNKQKEEIQSTLSELKSTQKQLIQSEKMASLGELTAGIAHEIQNPLNFVNNFSEVNIELIDELKAERLSDRVSRAGLKQKAERSEQFEEDIINDIKENSEKIIHHGKRADAIVKGMLEHSRMSTGKKEPTNINALADEYLRLSYHGMRAKDKTFNATMKTDFDETIGKINIVPQDIGRVLLNLFNNAFYATSQKQKAESQKQNEEGKTYKPTVWVSTKRIAGDTSPLGRQGGAIEIRVKDNGNGIPEKVKDKIFQPFFTTKPTGEGTGLGLSLSYDIIKAHDGDITVNTKEGDGTEFVVRLPG